MAETYTVWLFKQPSSPSAHRLELIKFVFIKNLQLVLQDTHKILITPVKLKNFCVFEFNLRFCGLFERFFFPSVNQHAMQEIEMYNLKEVRDVL